MAVNKEYYCFLMAYGNPDNLKPSSYRDEDITKIKYHDPNRGLNIEFNETNSKVKDKYSLNFESSKYIVEGTTNKSESKEAMIHHHPEGHKNRHLQFKLISDNKKIRVILEFLDAEDYQKCIKGFLYISQKVVDLEKEENNIKDDLQGYFFNDNIKTLKFESFFLLNKIRLAAANNRILDDNDKPLDAKQIEKLKAEKHLLPFFDWEA